jgi:hypothetical protein
MSDGQRQIIAIGGFYRDSENLASANNPKCCDEAQTAGKGVAVRLA